MIKQDLFIAFDGEKIALWCTGPMPKEFMGKKEEFSNCQTYYDDLKSFLKKQKELIWQAGHSVGGTTSLAAGAKLPGF